MTPTAPRARRSLIFAPGDRPELYPKALRAGADIVCVDIEDAVAPPDKARARAVTLALFEAPAPDDGIERLVRINSLRTHDGLRDIDAILETATPPPGLLVPKVESADELRLLADLLSSGPHAAIRFQVIIETNAGLEAAPLIARASPRIDLLAFGGVDMAAELRAEPSWEALLYARSRLVTAAAGAGIDALDVPHLDLDDAGGLEADAVRAAALGFTGKAAIHPRQIAAINRVFSPSADQLVQARKIIAAWEASDRGVVVVDGKLIERPVLRSMHRLIAVAERLAEREN